MPHDPYLTTTIDAIGVERTIIALQHHAQRSWNAAQTLRSHGIPFGAATHLETATWAYRNARILMGIEP